MTTTPKKRRPKERQPVRPPGMKRRSDGRVTKKDAASVNAAKRVFLANLREGKSITAAALAAGTFRQNVYPWRKDEAFAKAWDDALEAGTDKLEDELVRRAVEGWDEPEFYKGQVVGATRKFSDNCLITALKGRRPEKFRERFEHTGANGEPLTPVRSMSDEQLAAAIAGMVARLSAAR